MLNKFLQYIRYEKRYSEHTCISYQSDLFQFRDYLCTVGGGDFDPELVEREDVRSWMSYLMEKGDSASSINRKLSSLKSFYRFLKTLGIEGKRPMQGIVAPKREHRLPTYLRAEEVETLLDENPEDTFGTDFEGLRNRLIVDTFYTLGIRRAELIGLRFRDVDMRAGTVKVFGKGGKQRIIPFGEELRASFESYLQKWRQVSNMEDGALFCRADGSPMYPMLVYRIIRKYLALVSTQQKKSPHVLRHTFATAMLNNGAELNAVKELLGHANLAATEVYTHLTFEQLKKIYKQAHPRA